MNRKIFFFIILLLTPSIVSSLDNQLDLNSLNVSTTNYWNLGEVNKIYVNSLGINESSVKISNISFRINENISYNHTLRYLSQGKYRIDVDIYDSFIDTINFNIKCYDEGKIVEYSGKVDMKEKSSFDFIKESLIDYAEILDDFFDMEILVTFAYIFGIGIIICLIFFLSYKAISEKKSL